MKKYFLIIASLLLTFMATSAPAQTAVATFDSPLCSGTSVGVYDGIDFSLSPWVCDKTTLSGQTGTSISWSQPITTGRFKFEAPRVLLSVSAAATIGSGVLTITTDAGETFSHSINSTFETLHTGFKEAASVITVNYPGGRTIQLDNIAFQSAGKLALSAVLTWDDGTPVQGSVVLNQVFSPTTHQTIGMFTLSSTGAVQGNVTVDLNHPDPLTFQVTLFGPAHQSVGSSSFQVLKGMFPVTATGLNAKIVLWKENATIKTFNIGLTP